MENLKKLLKKEIKKLRETKYRQENGLNNEYTYASDYTLKLIMTKKQMALGFGTIRFDGYEKQLAEVKKTLEIIFPELKITYIDLKNGFDNKTYKAIRVSK